MWTSETLRCVARNEPAFGAKIDIRGTGLAATAIRSESEGPVEREEVTGYRGLAARLFVSPHVMLIAA